MVQSYQVVSTAVNTLCPHPGPAGCHPGLKWKLYRGISAVPAPNSPERQGILPWAQHCSKTDPPLLDMSGLTSVCSWPCRYSFKFIICMLVVCIMMNLTQYNYCPTPVPKVRSWFQGIKSVSRKLWVIWYAQARTIWYSSVQEAALN